MPGQPSPGQPQHGGPQYDRTLDSAVALITGAGGGVGAATARRLARAGAAVALITRSRDRMDEVVGDIAALGGKAVALAADITDPDGARDAVQDAVDWFGRLDVLVNNAGVMLVNSALHATVEEWDRMVSLNVGALLHVTHAAVPYLIDAAATSPRQVADLVNVGSTAGRAARPGSSVYDLTRFGLNGFSESLRQELLGEGVRVSVIEPGRAEVAAEDVADAIGYVVTRERRVAVNEIVLRAGDR
ncbi:SDR family oxidoreductase [Promicromonospora sp. NPDC057138]|uniref:SDR family oxidoreductase n=1 Tax=Promicromonospora sp. NPDC057138 TaxID=3346031 RepID=UPI00364562F7